MKTTLQNFKKSFLLALVLSIGVFGITFAQSGKFSYQFNTDGNAENWVAVTSGASIAVSGGQMNVTMALISGKNRADIRHTGGETVNSTYPIIAIKFNKPATANVFLDTNLGSYRNGANKWTGVLGTANDIYYFDLAAFGFGANNTMITAETVLTTFQFKVADVTSGETSYSVDWIESFASLAELQATLGVESKSFQAKVLNVYPNPSTGKFFNIDLNGYSKDVVAVKVYNMLGNLVLEKTVNATTTRIDNSLSTGVYIVKVENSAVKLFVE